VSKEKQYSEEELLEDLKRVAMELGESPTQRQYSEHGQYSVEPFRNRFQTWNKAKKEAGLEVSTSVPANSKASIDEIISDLKDGKSFKQVAEEHGYSSTTGHQAVSAKLRRHGYRKRPRLTKNEAAYSGDRFSGIISIPASTLDELGIESVEQGYYDIEVFQEDGEKGVKITFHDSRITQVEDAGENR